MNYNVAEDTPMADFKILTDSCSDLSPALVQDLELDVFPMTFVLSGQEYQNYPDDWMMANREFYDRLRGGSQQHSAPQ